jgi:surface polysaccharide O-acyltransferase-like enzyme
MIFVLEGCKIGAGTVDQSIINVIKAIISIIQIGVPILLVIWGMLDLGKAVIAQKEDEIKNGQKIFMKRLIAAAIVFFIVVIVKFLVQLVGGPADNSCWKAIFGV